MLMSWLPKKYNSQVNGVCIVAYLHRRNPDYPWCNHWCLIWLWLAEKFETSITVSRGAILLQHYCCPAEWIVCSMLYQWIYSKYICAFTALTLLVGIRKSIGPVKWWVLVWLSVWSEVQIVWYMVQLMPLHPKTYHLFPRLNADWFYHPGAGLPRLSWRLLNGHSSSRCNKHISLSL